MLMCEWVVGGCRSTLRVARRTHRLQSSRDPREGRPILANVSRGLASRTRGHYERKGQESSVTESRGTPRRRYSRVPKGNARGGRLHDSPDGLTSDSRCTEGFCAHPSLFAPHACIAVD